MVKRYKIAFLKPSKAIRFNNKRFKKYLVKDVLEENLPIINELAEYTNVYIFSGIIRDFFLDSKGNRDLDIVVDEIPASFLDSISKKHGFVRYKRNKFNGLKITLEDLNIDLWEMKDTWALHKKRLPINIQSLLKTPFFNFSSIIYDYKKEEFTVGEPFKDFIDNRILNVVYSHNLEPESCLISTMHYAKQYRIGVSHKLSRWLRDNFNVKYDYTKYQVKRYGKREFSLDDIESFINNPNQYAKENHKRYMPKKLRIKFQ